MYNDLMLSEFVRTAPQNTPTRQIKVAHLLSGERVWGVENYVHNLLCSNAAKSIKPTIVCSSAGVIADKFMNAGFQVEIVPMKGYLNPTSVFHLKQLFQAQEIEIVHTHLGVDSMLGTLAAVLAHVPTVTSVHFDQPNYVNLNPLKRVIWNRAQVLKNMAVSHFLPITENVANELQRREFVSRSKMTVVHPGIPLFEADQSKRMQIRQELCSDYAKLIIIGVGRLELEKNFAFLIDAMKEFDANSPVELWIVGDGSQRKILDAQIKRLGLSQRVRMLGYRPDVKSLLLAADIFVLPSKFEPFGMSAVEAMIATLPVVATKGPGLGTIVDDQKTGILVDPNDSKALYQALSRLVCDAELRRQFGTSGRERAIKTFTDEKMAEDVLNIYTKVLAVSATKTVPV